MTKHRTVHASAATRSCTQKRHKLLRLLTGLGNAAKAANRPTRTPHAQPRRPAATMPSDVRLPTQNGDRARPDERQKYKSLRHWE